MPSDNGARGWRIRGTAPAANRCEPLGALDLLANGHIIRSVPAAVTMFRWGSLTMSWLRDSPSSTIAWLCLMVSLVGWILAVATAKVAVWWGQPPRWRRVQLTVEMAQQISQSDGYALLNPFWPGRPRRLANDCYVDDVGPLRCPSHNSLALLLRRTCLEGQWDSPMLQDDDAAVFWALRQLCALVQRAGVLAEAGALDQPQLRQSVLPWLRGADRRTGGWLRRALLLRQMLHGDSSTEALLRCDPVLAAVLALPDLLREPPPPESAVPELLRRRLHQVRLQAGNAADGGELQAHLRAEAQRLTNWIEARPVGSRKSPQ